MNGRFVSIYNTGVAAGLLTFPGSLVDLFRLLVDGRVNFVDAISQRTGFDDI